MESGEEPEVVVRSGVEGGCVTLYRARSAAGGWEYFRELNQVMLCDMAETMDGSSPDEPIQRGRSVPTFEEGLALLDEDPWARFYADKVHPEYADRVFDAAMRRLRRGPTDERSRYRIENWRRACYPDRDDGERREARPHYLSKTRFVTGLQCQKRLWWEVHDRDSPELIPAPAMQAIFDRGHRVGAAARAFVPGGVLIDAPAAHFQARIDATRAAIDAGAAVVYEAAFMADGVFVSVDLLEREPGGFALIEVKSTLGVKEQHLSDVAIQLHVLRRAGIVVTHAEVMHLNRDCHHPDLSNLFVRADVTREAEELAAAIPTEVAEFFATLAGPEPSVDVGPHCSKPYPCPFTARCWPPTPRHHVSTLYRIHASKVEALVAAGHDRVTKLPPEFELSEPARRQVRAARTGRVVVEPTLNHTLEEIPWPRAFLDFETVAPAIPVWPGCRPYTQVPVQFSCYVDGPDGLTYRDYLADGPGDPREALAREVLAACAGARAVVAYNASFEQRCLAHLAEAVPALAAELAELSARIVDLLPIVRDHVYHPDFGGSFSLKAVLPALVPELGYDDLEIADGEAASAALEDLLLRGELVPASVAASQRAALLAYCERDVKAMVGLLDRLAGLAQAAAKRRRRR